MIGLQARCHASGFVIKLQVDPFREFAVTILEFKNPLGHHLHLYLVLLGVKHLHIHCFTEGACIFNRFTGLLLGAGSQQEY